MPIFVVKDRKLWAKYVHQGYILMDLGANYELHDNFLQRLWGSVASAAAAFQQDLGRQHGGITAENVFVTSSRSALLWELMLLLSIPTALTCPR